MRKLTLLLCLLSFTLQAQRMQYNVKKKRFDAFYPTANPQIKPIGVPIIDSTDLAALASKVTSLSGSVAGKASQTAVEAAFDLASKALPFAGSLTQMAAQTAPVVYFNGGPWDRKTGLPPSTPDGVLTVAAQAGFYYERIVRGPVPLELFGLVYDAYGFEEVNRIALTKAFASGRALVGRKAIVYTGGTVTVPAGTRFAFDGVGIDFRHNTNNTLFDFDAGVTGYIKNVSVTANGSFSVTAAGMRLTVQTGVIPGFVLQNIQFTRVAGNQEWGRGLVLTNPNHVVLEDVIAQGRGLGDNGGVYSPFIGIDILSTTAAVSSIFTRCKSYNGSTGIRVRSSTQAGIEGMKWIACDVVGSENGYDFESTIAPTAYLPPQLVLIGCHADVAKTALSIKNFLQVNISGSLFYASPLANTTSTAVYFENTPQLKFTNSEICNIGQGGLYGVVTGGTPNEIRLLSLCLKMGSNSGGNSGIVFSPGTTSSVVDDIYQTGGQSVFFNPGSNNKSANMRLNGVLQPEGENQTTLLLTGNFQAMNLDTGPYTVRGGVTGMPTAGTNWLVTVIHYDETPEGGGGAWWRCLAMNMFSPGVVWSGGRDGAGNWLGWKKIVTTTDATLTLTVSAAAGSGATTSITATDAGYTITVNTGAAPTAGTLLTVNLSNAFPQAVQPIIQPGKGTSMPVYTLSETANSFQLGTIATPNASTTYYYHVRL